jgi:SAM-dependent methyltransferase
MQREYDRAISAHYRSVAEQQGLSPSSTIADETIRARETAALLAAAAEARRLLGPELAIVDVGCGNGYTLTRMMEAEADARLTGIEPTPELRALAASRFADASRVAVEMGDVRDPDFAGGRQFDLLICQRVLINLLEPADQRAALGHLVASVRRGGFLAFIEAFASPLERLNEARREFALPDIPPAHHNLYLPDDFFTGAGLVPHAAAELPPENFLSSHYFVTRVLHAIMLGDNPFKHNSHLVRFLTEALPPAIGDYAPLRFLMFRKPAGWTT